MLKFSKKIKKTSIIITMPGADHNYKIIYSILKNFHKKIKMFSF